MIDDQIHSIEHALSLFHIGEDGRPFVHCAFNDIAISLRLRGETTRAFDRLSEDVWNICSLALRLEWMRRLACSGELAGGHWRTFSSLDIESIFVQVRSAMDHVAGALSQVATKRGQLPGSFQDLRSGIDRYANKLQSPIPELVRSCTWFEEMRDVRNLLIHHGGQSVVFGEPNDGIIFQVHGSSFREIVSHDAFMFNNNVVYFDRYIALLFANLLSLLERLGIAVAGGGKVSGAVGSAQIYWPGFDVLENWMRGTLAALRDYRAAIS